ncbi:restriction endonuclease subunit S [Staphylococcus chromogenes]|uniref:restriction endonuclease subunit S n=1 Tax=Staphylococcus chromogenes TaxID=46126 RepID=UPI00140550E0|nr:restriction endonuclease subunit S [Staphylococcus chromogenes]QIN25715.1 restriction endonuclease subunit S [Staphylococcus chromogenes]
MTKTPQHNVPELRFPEFEEEWVEKTLGDSIKLLKSGLSRELSSIDIGLPVIRANNIVERKLWLNDLKYWYVDDPKGANTENYHLERQDILVNFINSESKMGTSCIINQVLDRNYIYTTNILRWVTKHNYEPYFHYTITQTSNYIKWIKIITKPAVNQASFTTVDFKKIPYNLPSYQEQQKIGMFFSKLDRQIELEEKKLELLEQQKKGYMQKIFSQELRFKDENGKDYLEWEETTIEKTTKYSSSKKSSNQYTESNDSEGYPVYDAIQEIGKDLQYDMKEPYISILKDGAGVGRLNLRAGQSSVIGTMGYLQPNNVDLQFLYYKMNMLNFKKYVIGSTIPHLYYKDYSKEKIQIPSSFEEQKKIGHFILNIDKMIEIKTFKIDYLKQRKQGLLQKMFI